jgi:ribosome-binding protein aMBF1 (putative translation factor)
MGTTKKSKGWLEQNLEDEEFRRLLEHEKFIEKYLNVIDEEMRNLGLPRAELARRMGCKPSNITQIMRRIRNLNTATMVDIAFFLGLKLDLEFHLTESEQDVAKYRLQNVGRLNKS